MRQETIEEKLTEKLDIAFKRIEYLERKLAMCRDALREIAKYGKDHDGCCPYGCDTPYIATETLKATEPK